MPSTTAGESTLGERGLVSLVRGLHDAFPIPATGVRLLALLAISATFAILSPYFLLPNNLANIAINVAVVGIVACPLTVLMIARQVDLSVGSAVGFCAIVFGLTFPDYGAAVAIPLTFCGALLVAALNGFLVTIVGVNSLVVTLATLAIFRGLARILASGQTIRIDGFGFISDTRIYGIPLAVIILVAVAAAFTILLRYTVYGQHMYALGANPRASRLAGIKARRNLLVAFLLGSICVTIATLVLTSQVGASLSDSGAGLELLAITGIILGGASLGGGRGTILGTMSALLILAVLDNGLTLLNVQSFWQDVARGAVLILAVTADQVRVRFDRLIDEDE